MAQKFNQRTLTGNWFEERFDPAPPEEPSIVRYTKKNPKPLIQNQVVADYGNREFTTTTATEYVEPSSKLASGSSVLGKTVSGHRRMINRDNVQRVMASRNMAEREGRRSFASVLPSVIPSNNERYLETTSRVAYGEPDTSKAAVEEVYLNMGPKYVAGRRSVADPYASRNPITHEGVGESDVSGGLKGKKHILPGGYPVLTHQPAAAKPSPNARRGGARDEEDRLAIFRQGKDTGKVVSVRGAGPTVYERKALVTSTHLTAPRNKRSVFMDE